MIDPEKMLPLLAWTGLACLFTTPTSRLGGLRAADASAGPEVFPKPWV